MIRGPSWSRFVRFRQARRISFLLVLGVSLFIVRITKGAGFSDAYAFLSRPFWPGPSQKEWIEAGIDLESRARLSLLEADNQRLREMLSLKKALKKNRISAPVIARTPKGWWQQIQLGKGHSNGVRMGDPVIAPGGLLGFVRFMGMGWDGMG